MTTRSHPNTQLPSGARLGEGRFFRGSSTFPLPFPTNEVRYGMGSSRRRWGIAAVLLCAACVCDAGDVEPVSGAQRRLLEQVALGKARTALWEQLGGLELGRSLTVQGWVARNVERDRALRLWVRTLPASGAARVYTDGVCEADVCLDGPALERQLIEWRVKFPDEAGESLAEQQITDAARHWPRTCTTGTATLDEDLDPQRPPGWADITNEGAVLAQRAAEADAVAALMEDAGRLRVTNARRLREFLGVSTEIRAAVAAAFLRDSQREVVLAPDQVAVATLRLGKRDLLRILTQVHSDLYQGTDFAAADFRGMTLLIDVDTLVATGLAPPPASARLRNRFEPIEKRTPPWITQTLTAAGRYVPRDGEALDRGVQEEAARLDGVDALRRQAEALVIQGNTTVGDFCGYHQELKGDVILFLSGARVAGTPRVLTDGTLELPVELPLRRLWEIVRRKMRVAELEPPSTQPVVP